MRASARSIRRDSQRKIAAARAIVEDLEKSQLQLNSCRHPSIADLNAAEASPVPLAVLGRGGMILETAPPLCLLFGTRPGHLRYRPLTELLDPQDLPRFLRFLARCEAACDTRRSQFTMGLPGKETKEILLVIRPVSSRDDSRQTIFAAAFVDLSESQPGEFGPRSPRDNTRLIQAIDGILWEADYPKRFTFISSQVERLLGFSAKQWTSDPQFWQNHVHHEDRERVVQARTHAARDLAPHALEYRMITADRNVIWVKDSAVNLSGGHGYTRMCGIITDVSDLEITRERLKRANETLEAAVTERTAKMEQSVEAMETLCYGIAHDLKAPIRSIQGFVGLLTTDYHEAFDEDGRKYALRCQLALNRMSELIEAILAYGRLNHTVPELIPIDPRHVIERVLASLEPDVTARKTRMDVQMTMPRVVGNPYLLEQVFTNLIANALKFVRPGECPEISISAIQMEDMKSKVGDRRSEDQAAGTGSLASEVSLGEPPSGGLPQPFTHSTASTPVIRITFTDNGIGIPPHAVERMFGMFQKLHRAEDYPGTGVGLAVVKRAVELMNGHVGVFSEPGHGSSFWIELPSAS